jgi:hypothetical protein
LARLVPCCDWLAGQRANRWVLDVEIVFARLRFLEQLAAAMSKKLVESDLYFEGGIAVVAIDVEIGVFDEGNWFMWRFGGEDVSERDVLEAFGLSDIVVVGYVDS